MEEIVVRLHLEKPYRFLATGNLYSPLFFCYDGRTDTDKVAYVGLTGRDKGRHFVCPIMDWHLRFQLIEDKEDKVEERKLPPRMAGNHTAGSGV